MANLKTDSPLCRHIVRAFLDFLNSVEPAPGVDFEGVEVAKECLADVFKISPADHSQTEPGLLVSMFNSRETSKQQQHSPDPTRVILSSDMPSTSSARSVSDTNFSEGSQNLGEDLTREAYTSGLFDDELFGQFFDALEKIHYFKTASDGCDDQVQLDRATHLFHNALKEMQKSGFQTCDRKSLAEAFKALGNKAMQSKLHFDAVELYTFAISLIEDSAIYYCNRAAAYTQMHQYDEAIRDSLKSADINPYYTKAYSRLGFAYYAQGKYKDAIEKGFAKALQLDPNNASVKENIRVAEQKLKEERQRKEHHQSSSSASRQEPNHESAWDSRSHAAPPPFTSMPSNVNGLPAGIASMLTGMAANVYQGQHVHGMSGSGSDHALDVPEIRIDGNINLNLGEQIPEELAGTLRSMMGMFSGGATPGNPPDDGSGRLAQS